MGKISYPKIQKGTYKKNTIDKEKLEIEYELVEPTVTKIN